MCFTYNYTSFDFFEINIQIHPIDVFFLYNISKFYEKEKYYEEVSKHSPLITRIQVQGMVLHKKLLFI